jgi:hypothetical protein
MHVQFFGANLLIEVVVVRLCHQKKGCGGGWLDMMEPLLP